jgi:hypothetical protein
MPQLFYDFNAFSRNAKWAVAGRGRRMGCSAAVTRGGGDSGARWTRAGGQHLQHLCCEPHFAFVL